MKIQLTKELNFICKRSYQNSRNAYIKDFYEILSTKLESNNK